ncbi:hypothetical protein [Moraxella lacunata]|uniref:hypothetical protein n=1 Tax=Moraxella lacunata TaxID=477 RepID=UPI003EE25BEA
MITDINIGKAHVFILLTNRLPAKLQLKKTVRGELCLPITVFRYPSTSSGRTENLVLQEV